MALTAKEEWVRLNKAINCKHYIGARSWNLINDSFEGKPEESESSMRANAHNIKNPFKTLARAKKDASK